MSQGKKLKVLVVDDEKVIRDFFIRFLKLESVEVSAVEDGLQAVEALKKEVFDLAFLDIRMPKINGWEAFGQLHRLAPNMFCVFMTGYASEVKIIQKIEKLGVICLKKPFADLNLLKEIIRHAVLWKSQLCLARGKTIKERRVYPRLVILLDVDYRIKQEWRLCLGKIKNIALGGLKLRVRENLAPGTELELVMKSPGHKEAYPVRAKVVWIKKAKEGLDYYDVGVRFLEIDLSRLAEFMAHCEKVMHK